jgi:hypothetical protein
MGGGLTIALGVVGFALPFNAAYTKAANAWSGLSSPLLTLIRRAGDHDGDGFASILGGGDCDDGDPGIHPLAIDLPGDGIDQNCTGADAPSLQAFGHVAQSLPAGVPNDLNVVLFTIDTVRADHVGAYGYARPTTPAIDAFARESVVFDQAWSNSSYTKPSLTSIMTGRYLSQVRWVPISRGRAISGDNGTIAGIMKAVGASTGGSLSCSTCLSPQEGFAQGFDDYDTSTTEAQVQHRSSSGQQVDWAISWMRKAKGRFFLWVHFLDTHPQFVRHLEAPDFGSDAIGLFDNDLRYTDTQIGRALSWITDSGLGTKTAILLTSDHGWDFGGRWIPRSRYLYPDQTSVPLIVHIPGIRGRHLSQPVSHIDILPTIAQLAGVEIPVPLPGRSLLPLMLGAAEGDERAPVFQMVEEGDQQRRSVIDGCSLLIHNILPEPTFEHYDVCRLVPDQFVDRYDATADQGLRQLLLRMEDKYQVPLPAWIPSR